MQAQPTKSQTITERNLLLVEGRDEEMFFKAMVRNLKLQSLQIMPLQGKSALPYKIKAVKLLPGFDSIVSVGITRDADENPDTAFESVCGALRSAGLGVPEKPCEAAGTNPTVRVFILPSNERPGMLEDLCLEAIADDPAMTCVESFFRCLKDTGIPLPGNMSKARIQTFLASREKPGLRLGEAAADYIPCNAAAFARLADFLRQVIA